MSEGVRETQCTSCIHREVCCNKAAFLRAIEEIDKLYVDLGDSGVWLNKVPWMKVKPTCTNFYPIPITVRQDPEVLLNALTKPILDLEARMENDKLIKNAVYGKEEV